ncbi:MAG: SDR family oxidoreductase [Bryobacteraceae bacterium]
MRVNSIVPATMDTPMNGHLLATPTVRERCCDDVPVGRLGTPADIEGIAVFLASDEPAYCTGGTLHVRWRPDRRPTRFRRRCIWFRSSRAEATARSGGIHRRQNRVQYFLRRRKNQPSPRK